MGVTRVLPCLVLCSRRSCSCGCVGANVARVHVVRWRARGSLARRTVSSPPVPCCPCEGVMCLWCVLVCLKTRTQLRGTLNQCTLTVRGLPLVSCLVAPAPVSVYAASAVARSGAIGQLRVPGVTSQHAAAVPRVRRAAAVVLLLARCCYGRVGLLLRWS